MNTEASKKQFLGEYDIEVDFKAKSLGFKDLVTTNNGFYESLYNKVNYRMIEMFRVLNKIDFDIEDVDVEVGNSYYWESLAGCNLELLLTTEQYLELLQSSVTKSNQMFLAYLDKTIDFKIEECEQENCCLVKEPTKLEYYLNLVERIASINYHYQISLRTQELEEEINTIIKQREF
jgi:hypothetical protein